MATTLLLTLASALYLAWMVATFFAVRAWRSEEAQISPLFRGRFPGVTMITAAVFVLSHTNALSLILTLHFRPNLINKYWLESVKTVVSLSFWLIAMRFFFIILAAQNSSIRFEQLNQAPRTTIVMSDLLKSNKCNSSFSFSVTRSSGVLVIAFLMIITPLSIGLAAINSTSFFMTVTINLATLLTIYCFFMAWYMRLKDVIWITKEQFFLFVWNMCTGLSLWSVPSTGISIFGDRLSTIIFVGFMSSAVMSLVQLLFPSVLLRYFNQQARSKPLSTKSVGPPPRLLEFLRDDENYRRFAQHLKDTYTIENLSFVTACAKFRFLCLEELKKEDTRERRTTVSRRVANALFGQDSVSMTENNLIANDVEVTGAEALDVLSDADFGLNADALLELHFASSGKVDSVTDEDVSKSLVDHAQEIYDLYVDSSARDEVNLPYKVKMSIQDSMQAFANSTETVFALDVIFLYDDAVLAIMKLLQYVYKGTFVAVDEE